VNPVITESRGEWVHDEGCLSIPRLYVEIAAAQGSAHLGVRPRRQRGAGRGGRARGRLFQHELDHLDGVLMFERMTAEQRKEA
jgi:peptide deformylase